MMRLHVFSEGEHAPRTHKDLDASTPVGEIVKLVEEERLFIVDDEGREVERVDIRIDEVFSAPIGRLVKHRRPRVEVSVRYNGRDAQFDETPGVVLEAVRSKAIAELGIDANDAADLDLRTTENPTVPLEMTEPLGALVHGRDAIAFELVPRARPQG